MLVLKKSGFSIEEIRHMTMADFIVFADLLCESSSARPKVREATQADIDRLLG